MELNPWVELLISPVLSEYHSAIREFQSWPESERPSRIEALTKALQDEGHPANAMAVVILAAQDDRLLPSVGLALRSSYPHPVTARSAVDAFRVWSMERRKKVVMELAQSLDSHSETDVLNALAALGKVRPDHEWVLSAIERCTTSPDYKVASAASKLLGRTFSPSLQTLRSSPTSLLDFVSAEAYTLVLIGKSADARLRLLQTLIDRSSENWHEALIDHTGRLKVAHPDRMMECTSLQQALRIDADRIIWAEMDEASLPGLFTALETGHALWASYDASEPKQVMDLWARAIDTATAAAPAMKEGYTKGIFRNPLLILTAGGSEKPFDACFLVASKDGGLEITEIL